MSVDELRDVETGILGEIAETLRAMLARLRHGVPPGAFDPQGSVRAVVTDEVFQINDVPPYTTRARITVEDAAIRFWPDGSSPSSGADGAGHLLNAGDVLELDSHPALFRAIRNDATDAVLQISFFG